MSLTNEQRAALESDNFREGQRLLLEFLKREWSPELADGIALMGSSIGAWMAALDAEGGNLGRRTCDVAKGNIDLVYEDALERMRK